MKLKPLEERVILKRCEDITSDTLILPASVVKASLTAIVINIGPGCKSVQVGDKVLYARWSGFELPFRNDYYENLLMNESDILAIVEED